MRGLRDQTTGLRVHCLQFKKVAGEWRSGIWLGFRF